MSEPPKEPSSLRVLAIGVSQYKNLQRLPMAREDAEALAAVFKRQEGGSLFRTVDTQVLCDQQATEGAIRAALGKLPEKPAADDVTPAATPDRKVSAGEPPEKCTADDVAVVVLSGHGLDDPVHGFLFLPHEYDPSKEPSETALSGSDLVKFVQAFPGSVLVIIDTCHSGAAGMDFSATRDQLIQSGKGRFLLAACLSDEKAAERKAWRHGALSLAVWETLAGEIKYPDARFRVELPPGDDRGRISFADLQYYAVNRVGKLNPDQAVLPGNTGKIAPGRFFLAERKREDSRGESP